MWLSSFVITAVDTRGSFRYRDLQEKKKLQCTDSSFDNKHFKILGFFDKSVDPDLRVSFAVSQYVRSLKLRPYLWAAARKPDTQPSAPHYTDNLKTKHQIRQA
jgi:hypothetical protein